jgi:16S rRNA (cytosine1402-N4)-methyltransferase
MKYDGPHKPVLVQEVLQYLDPRPGKTYLDVTFGSGGHTRAILEKEPDCKVIAMDWDEVTLERFGQELKAEFGDRLQLLWGNFALLYRLLKREGIEQVDGILADFGTSQVQISERPGLSLFKEAGLDMRMSPAHQKETAADIVNNATERELADIFFTFGQERYSRKVARALVEKRVHKRIETTKELVDIINSSIPTTPGPIHKATRIFQALRIFVNRELHNIRAFLPAALQLLPVNGRLVCISFHSLEDRIVKQWFKEQSDAGIVNILTPKVVIPTMQEVHKNPSSRSSKLRAVQVLISNKKEK